MMKRKTTLIYDIAAENGGGLAILHEYYKKAFYNTHEDYIFVISQDCLIETDNIRIIRLPWVKKSWFHRIYCDLVFIQRLIKRTHCDEVLSLQNIAVFRCKKMQTVYVQNCIPFSEYKFSLLKEPKFWIYQNVIGGIAKLSIKRVDRVVVQSMWMREAIEKQCGIDAEQVDVAEVRVVDFSNIIATQKHTNDTSRFFYPAYAYPYKNHRIILDAVKIIKKMQINAKFEIIFTIDSTDNTYSKKLYEEINRNFLPIQLIGPLSKEEMKELYQKSILLFPSYLETVGLPLKEASSLKKEIIVADLPYAHEALGDYANVTYVLPDNTRMFAECIRKAIIEK